MILVWCSLVISSLIICISSCYRWLKEKCDKQCTFSAVLLVIAHPDDETMFFAPLLVTLHEQSIPVRILCISTGTGNVICA